MRNDRGFCYNEIMLVRGIINKYIGAAGLIAGLVILQQMISYVLFGLDFSWNVTPQLILVNFGIVAGWRYIKDPDKRIPAFAINVAAFCYTVWLRAVIACLSLFRLIAPIVESFLEKQFIYIMTFITAPQFVPAIFAALILLLILPKAKEIYRRVISNGTF